MPRLEWNNAVQPQMDADENGPGSAHAGVVECAEHPTVVRAGLSRTLDWFRCERVFREARKTAPGAGALPELRRARATGGYNAY